MLQILMTALPIHVLTVVPALMALTVTHVVVWQDTLETRVKQVLKIIKNLVEVEKAITIMVFAAAAENYNVVDGGGVHNMVLTIFMIL